MRKYPVLNDQTFSDLEICAIKFCSYLFFSDLCLTLKVPSSTTEAQVTAMDKNTVWNESGLKRVKMAQQKWWIHSSTFIRQLNVTNYYGISCHSVKVIE